MTGWILGLVIMVVVLSCVAALQDAALREQRMAQQALVQENAQLRASNALLRGRAAMTEEDCMDTEPVLASTVFDSYLPPNARANGWMNEAAPHS